MPDRTCEVEGCENPYRARGMCISCYSRFRANGGSVILPRRTDSLCTDCQVNESLKWSSKCRECANDYERHRRRKNAGNINALNRSRYSPAKRRTEYLRKYNLTPDSYAALLDSQEGKCAICRTESQSLHVDHDHSCCPEPCRSCGECVRGLLCPSCNNGIGRFLDDRKRILGALAYLERPVWRASSQVSEGM